MIGYLNADKEIIQEKSTASIETVAVLYGNEKVTETEDSKDTNVDTSAKSSLKSNTQKFLDIINNGVK
jgi:ribosomal protein L14E/L6E/L27E